MEPGGSIQEKVPWRHFPVRKSFWITEAGVILGKKGKADGVAEESRFAYKNIEEVMDNQQIWWCP